MAVYAVILMKVHNEDGYKTYTQGVVPVIMQHGVKLLAVDNEPSVVEGEWPWNHSVLLGFDDKEHFDRFYNSPEYQDIVKHRFEAADTQWAVLKEFKMPQLPAGS